MSDLQKVGPDYGGTGTFKPLTADISGAQRVQDAHARYFETTSRGNVFTAANSAVQALSLNSLTATGLILSNPVGSGKNFVIIDVTVSIAAAVTAVADVILCGTSYSATTTTHT